MPFARAARRTAVTLLLLGAGPASPQDLATGKVRGQVIDASDGVVPGVTVEVTTASQVLGTTVTDAQGEFEFAALPPGRLTLRMSLDGFEAVTKSLLVEAGGETWVSGRLTVAPFSEQVTVIAPAPPAPRVEPPQPPPPTYEVRPVPPLDLEGVCGPSKPATTTATPTIGAHRHDAARILYRRGDELNIESGGAPSLTVGQNLVARRSFQATGPGRTSVKGELAAGVVQVVTASPALVTAVVIHACGELLQGDRLIPFTPEPMPTAEPAGVPAYRQAARILFGDAGQLMGAPGRLMVIDRGQAHGIRPGQRLTLFRRVRGRDVVVGDAIALVVRADSARIRVERASDAIWSGDSAAPQEPRPALAAWRDTP